MIFLSESESYFPTDPDHCHPHRSIWICIMSWDNIIQILSELDPDLDPYEPRSVKMQIMSELIYWKKVKYFNVLEFLSYFATDPDNCHLHRSIWICIMSWDRMYPYIRHFQTWIRIRIPMNLEVHKRNIMLFHWYTDIRRIILKHFNILPF